MSTRGRIALITGPTTGTASEASFAEGAIGILVVGDVSLLMRSVYEERTLARDPEYVGYMERVRWRVLPGVL